MEGCAMGQVLHGSARTTAAVRRAIQHSQESLRVLARRYGINPKTVAKWKKRTSAADLPTGPKAPRSTVLTLAEEAVMVAFRRHTLLPLDDCLYALQPTLPHLTRSRRCGRIEEADHADADDGRGLGDGGSGVSGRALAPRRQRPERPSVPRSAPLLHAAQHQLAGAPGRVRELEFRLEAVLALEPGRRV